MDQPSILFHTKLCPSSHRQAAVAYVDLNAPEGVSMKVMLTSYEVSGKRFCTLYTCVEHRSGQLLEHVLVLKPQVEDCATDLKRLLPSIGFLKHVVAPITRYLEMLDKR